MTTPISDLVPLVAPEVMGCPQVLIRAKILQALGELCKRARIWQYEHPNIALVAGVRDYPFVPPTGSTVADVLRVTLDGEQLKPESLAALDEIYTDWRTETGDPVYYSRIKETVLTLIPITEVAAIVGTSVTSFTVGTGSKVFTTQAGLEWLVDDYVLIWSNANRANYMFGQVTTYTTTSLTVNVLSVGGSGTLTDWNISGATSLETAVVVPLVTLKPTPSATTIEDFIYNEHFDTIASGAKSMLMTMPGQKWSNPALAAYYLDQFNSGIAGASASMSGGNVSAPIRVSPCV